VEVVAETAKERQRRVTQADRAAAEAVHFLGQMLVALGHLVKDLRAALLIHQAARLVQAAAARVPLVGIAHQAYPVQAAQEPRPQ